MGSPSGSVWSRPGELRGDVDEVCGIDDRCDDQRLLSIAKSVAAVFIGVDEAKLNSLAVPSGTKNLEI